MDADIYAHPDGKPHLHLDTHGLADVYLDANMEPDFDMDPD